jgi:hypothetical protein
MSTTDQAPFEVAEGTSLFVIMSTTEFEVLEELKSNLTIIVLLAETKKNDLS